MTDTIDVRDPPTANLNDSKFWSVVKRCAALLTQQNIQYVLMGTAALAARGVKPKDVVDIDFLVKDRPTVGKSFAKADGSGKGCAYLVPFEEASDVTVDLFFPNPFDVATDADADFDDTPSIPSVKVDFVSVDNPVENGFLLTTADEVDGVRVMTIESALGIKRWKGREKDIEFFRLLEEQKSELARAAVGDTY